jgi:hypothetical protein
MFAVYINTIDFYNAEEAETKTTSYPMGIKGCFHGGKAVGV